MIFFYLHIGLKFIFIVIGCAFHVRNWNLLKSYAESTLRVMYTALERLIILQILHFKYFV